MSQNPAGGGKVLPFGQPWMGEGPKQFDHWQKSWQNWADTMGEFWQNQQKGGGIGAETLQKELAALAQARDPRSVAHQIVALQRAAIHEWLKSSRSVNDHLLRCYFQTLGFSCDLIPKMDQPSDKK